MAEVVLVKLGGSLLTEKGSPDTPRPEVIERLGRELAEISRARPGGLLVGHGSGSFGHVAAERYEIHRGLHAADQLPGVAITQERAAALHRLLVAALLEAGAVPFSWAPSSGLVAAAGRPVAAAAEPVVRSLELGLLPVTFGDVVLDRERGATICSTETVLVRLAEELRRAGFELRRALWLGETAGIVDRDGRTVAAIDPADPAAALELAGGSAATDVTGGMRHRLETALELARDGIVSSILDGRRPGVLARALAGETDGGTRVGPT